MHNPKSNRKKWQIGRGEKSKIFSNLALYRSMGLTRCYQGVSTVLISAKHAMQLQDDKLDKNI